MGGAGRRPSARSTDCGAKSNRAGRSLRRPARKTRVATKTGCSASVRRPVRDAVAVGCALASVLVRLRKYSQSAFGAEASASRRHRTRRDTGGASSAATRFNNGFGDAMAKAVEADVDAGHHGRPRPAARPLARHVAGLRVLIFFLFTIGYVAWKMFGALRRRDASPRSQHPWSQARSGHMTAPLTPAVAAGAPVEKESRLPHGEARGSGRSGRRRPCCRHPRSERRLVGTPRGRDRRPRTCCSPRPMPPGRRRSPRTC